MDNNLRWIVKSDNGYLVDFCDGEPILVKGKTNPAARRFHSIEYAAASCLGLYYAGRDAAIIPLAHDDVDYGVPV